jgi:hypothetical protein
MRNSYSTNALQTYVLISTVELLMRFELTTSSLPRKCSTPELQQQFVAGVWVHANVKNKHITRTHTPICNFLRTHRKIRAADEIRTRDIQLGRLTLYQLSYHRELMMNGK